MGIFKALQSFIFLSLLLISAFADHNERKTHIVYMGSLPEGKTSTSMELHHHNLLMETIGDETMAKELKLHSYGRSFNGFVANLSPREAEEISQKEGVVSVFLNKLNKLHTTRSWDFIGMAENSTKRNQKAESNIIVGVLDTGIWPDSPSFSDEGYGPPPAKWKGKCVKGANFTGCNNKVIGAQYFLATPQAGDILTPLDTEGHGTHTASTVAGARVRGASVYGIGRGTARGGVSSARIAAYKVCWDVGCYDADILAGFDHAIADGVDLISLSLGGYPRQYFEDSIAIGSFHAMTKGIQTICAGGNEGPDPFTIENVAPWITTVAASSIDRQFVANVELGNGDEINGIAVNTFSLKKKMYPLTSGALVANASMTTYYNASACDLGSLLPEKTKGKIVYCEGTGGDSELYDIGAGTIMSRDGYDDTAFEFLIPATTVSWADGNKINNYINSTKNPMAIIHKSKAVKMIAPFIASFSSRGPQTLSPNILKPDISAPGLSILAAFSKYGKPSGYTLDKRSVKYNILSGTSMATPHVSAAVAYLKTFHPTWSPAAIKSALMTTATPMKVKTEDLELASGSGQMNPIGALHPGLVYDINTSGYIRFLCKEGLNSTTIGLIVGGHKKYDCSSFKLAEGVDGLNYPSFHYQIKHNSTDVSAVFERIVTNVGFGASTYKATIVSPKGLKVTVSPTTLSFEKAYQKKSFKVVVKGKFDKNDESLLSGSLQWSDGKHIVTSPIVVYRSPYSDDN